MLNQIEVNPVTEKYTFTQVVSLPVFTGTELSPAVRTQMRATSIKDQVNAAFNVASDTGFYLNNGTEAILNQVRASVKNIIDTDQAVRAVIQSTTESATIVVTHGNSIDAFTQSIAIDVYIGTVKVISEIRVSAVNKFIASGNTLLMLNS